MCSRRPHPLVQSNVARVDIRQSGDGWVVVGQHHCPGPTFVNHHLEQPDKKPQWKFDKERTIAGTLSSLLVPYLMSPSTAVSPSLVLFKECRPICVSSKSPTALFRWPPTTYMYVFSEFGTWLDPHLVVGKSNKEGWDLFFGNMSQYCEDIV